MAWEKFHIFFKTSKVADIYNIDDIMGKNDFNGEKDHLYIYSRRNGLRENLIAIFDTLKCSFNLGFLLDDTHYSLEQLEETQIVFPLAKQHQILESINTLYSFIENQRVSLYGTDLSTLIDEAKLIETSKFSFEDNDSIPETIWPIEEIRRFFEDSIKEKKTIVKYDANT